MISRTRSMHPGARLGALLLSVAAVTAGCGPLPEGDSAPVAGEAQALGSAVPYVARHGLSAADYQAEFDRWVAQGYRLTDVSAYDVGGQTRFAAIWEKKSGPSWTARHGMSAAEYQSEFNARTAQGYRLTLVEGYESGGQARYAAIFEQKSGPAWTARHGLSAAQYQSEFNTLTRAGYRLVWVQGYGVGAAAQYAAIFEQGAGPAWTARHGLTAAQYQADFDSLTSQGFRLAQLSAYDVGGVDYYAAIFDKAATPAWVARHRMSAQSYQHEFVDRDLQGYRLRQVEGYAPSGAARYAAIWEAQPDAVGGSYCSGGKCFDLGRLADGIESALAGNVVKYGFEVRRGLSVIRRAAGPKRTAADAPAQSFTVHDRHNPASVSKAVTAVAMLQLLEKRRVGLDTPVWTYLSPAWSIPANNKTITFKELLNHSSGLRGTGIGGYDYEDMKTLMERPINLADKVSDYENVNYAVLRILVASLDGYSAWLSNPGPGTAARFISYVNAQVFSPLGIYDVEYKPADTAPTLFYPNPPGSANGTAYGDWSLRPGSAGTNASVHELAVFNAATFGGALLSPTKLGELKQLGLGYGDYGTLPDGSKCFGKGGYFPAGQNGGAELNSVVFSCDNGVSGMLLINGAPSASGLITDKLAAAFQP